MICFTVAPRYSSTTLIRLLKQHYRITNARSAVFPLLQEFRAFFSYSLLRLVKLFPGGFPRDSMQDTIDSNWFHQDFHPKVSLAALQTTSPYNLFCRLTGMTQYWFCSGCLHLRHQNRVHVKTQWNLVCLASAGSSPTQGTQVTKTATTLTSAFGHKQVWKRREKEVKTTNSQSWTRQGQKAHEWHRKVIVHWSVICTGKAAEY